MAMVLAVKDAATASEERLVVEGDFVIVGVGGFLDEGLVNG